MKVIDERLLDEFRWCGRCEWCKRAAIPADPHHVFAKGMGGGGRLDIRLNLIALCRLCHDRAHCGNIERADLLAIVASREGVLQADIVAEVHRLRRMKK